MKLNSISSFDKKLIYLYKNKRLAQQTKRSVLRKSQKPCTSEVIYGTGHTSRYIGSKSKVVYFNTTEILCDLSENIVVFLTLP